MRDTDVESSCMTYKWIMLWVDLPTWFFLWSPTHESCQMLFFLLLILKLSNHTVSSSASLLFIR